MEILALVFSFIIMYGCLHWVFEGMLQHGEEYAKKKYKEAGIPFNREKFRRGLRAYVYRGQRTLSRKPPRVDY